MYLFKKKGTSLTFIFMIFICHSYAAYSIQLNTILTDQLNKGKPAAYKSTFYEDTPVIYILWESAQLKIGERLKAVWIADDTHNAAPPHYTISSAEMILDKGMKISQSNRPLENEWQGQFSLTRPNNGWPIGTYHTEIYVNDQLVKSIAFSVIKQKNNVATAKINEQWDAIAVELEKQDASMAYGIGSGSSETEARTNALNFCIEAQGKECGVILGYQQCGAYSVSKRSKGMGVGATKEIADEKAIKQCNAADCNIIVSDCVRRKTQN